MHLFSMRSISDKPHSNGFPANIREMEQYHCKKMLFDKLGRIIDEYVVPREFSVEKEQPATSQSMTGNPHLARIHIEHQYYSVPVQCRQRRLPASVTSAAHHSQASQLVKKAAPDGVFSSTHLPFLMTVSCSLSLRTQSIREMGTESFVVGRCCFCTADLRDISFIKNNRHLPRFMVILYNNHKSCLTTSY